MIRPPLSVLMAVHNGAAHLPEQLDSFAAQTGVAWQLIASDDASTDDSRAVLERFGAAHPVKVVAGPGQGFARNFLSLLAQADGVVALADQDDIWFPGKLSRAMVALDRVPPEVPALYCSTRINWDAATDRRQPSRPYPHPPAFGNALVENIAVGNTIVLNAAATRIAAETASAAQDVPFHDWWLYLLITGIGGLVIHDAEPGLLYRQHQSNVVGQGEGLRGGLRVNVAALRGVYAGRITHNLQALQAIAPHLTPENRAQLDAFAQARQAPLTARLAGMRRAGVWRQSLAGRIGFWGAVCLGRI